MSVLTSTVPERREMLRLCIRSLLDQTHAPFEHLIGIDADHSGPAPILNELASKAEGEWLTVLDDDDVAEPNHLAVMCSSVQEDPEVDVVYTQPLLVGHNYQGYYKPFSYELLKTSSIVPVTAMVRREVFWAVGGFQGKVGYDWHLWQRIAENGGRFRAIPKITWQYVVHGANHSYGHFN